MAPLAVAAALGATVAAVALSSLAQEGAPARAPGYLGAGVPDSSVFIPPPPLGSPTDVSDIVAYERTRALQGGPRWEMAAKDASLSPAAVLGDFSCALGASLDQTSAPKILGLMTKLGGDVGASVEQAKEKYRRPRPFTRIPGPICTGNPEAMAKSWSYPSGHSTWGWTAALILAELAPDRAAEILARGRAYGESRVVCGVHYVSDVEAGRTNAAGLVAALHASPTFQADLAAARAEMATLRRAPGQRPDAPQCDALAQASAAPPW